MRREISQLIDVVSALTRINERLVIELEKTRERCNALNVTNTSMQWDLKQAQADRDDSRAAFATLENKILDEAVRRAQ